MEPQTPNTKLRSLRTLRPTLRFSSLLYYLLLTNGGELECYDKALEGDARMEEDMKSLITN